MQRLFKISIIQIILLLTFLSQSYSIKNPAEGKNEGEKGKTTPFYLYGATISPEMPSPLATPQEGSIIGKGTIRIINLGPIVNWKGLDYAPTISADGRTLYFVSNRPGSVLNDDGEPSHDFWAAKKLERLDTVFFKPYNIDTTTHKVWGDLGVNTPLNEGAASIAADKQSLYFTGCNRPDGLGSCDIYKTTIEGDKWGRPKNLGRFVNSKNFDSQPSIAPDQSRIYFVSTREGPNSNGENIESNQDIWYCDWDYDAEDWKPAKNLTAINTKGRDVSPFIAADNQTLFFASDGWQPNYGGLDFYVTRYNPETDKWSKPENLGEPINTSADEQFITLPASGDIIYFSSRRKDLSGYQGDFDIFMAFVPTFFRAVNLKGSVIDECSRENIPAHVTIKNPLTGRIVEDSLNQIKTMFEMVVSNTDYGNPKDSIKYVDLEITADNPKYGKTVMTQRVEKPAVTENPNEAGKVADEINVTLTLGQMPEIGTQIEEAEHIKENKGKEPQLAGFNGLVMKQVNTWDLYPLLNYVFFDLGSSKIPDRYVLFKSSEETESFSDTTIVGGTLDKYYHILNIYGFRLKQFPDAKIEIVGCNDGKTAEEKKPNLSKERAQAVYDYFKNVWQIPDSRMKIVVRNQPQVISNLNDSMGIVENRRVEILCNDWNIMKPIFDKDPKTFPQPEAMKFTMKNGIEDALVAKRRIEIKRGDEMWKVLSDVGTIDKTTTWDWRDEKRRFPKDEVPYTAQLILTTSSGSECKSLPVKIPVMQVKTEQQQVGKLNDSTWEKYSLILFPFDRSDAGPINSKIMEEYVYNRCFPTSKIEVIGHTDVVGLYDHNAALSERRSKTVYTGIMKKTKGVFGQLTSRGVGEDEPLYTNELPEGRFYNRTVQVIIKTPLSQFK